MDATAKRWAAEDAEALDGFIGSLLNHASVTLQPIRLLTKAATGLVLHPRSHLREKVDATAQRWAAEDAEALDGLIGSLLNHASVTLQLLRLLTKAATGLVLHPRSHLPEKVDATARRWAAEDAEVLDGFIGSLLNHASVHSSADPPSYEGSYGIGSSSS